MAQGNLAPSTARTGHGAGAGGRAGAAAGAAAGAGARAGAPAGAAAGAGARAGGRTGGATGDSGAPRRMPRRDGPPPERAADARDGPPIQNKIKKISNNNKNIQLIIFLSNTKFERKHSNTSNNKHTK